MAFLLNFELLPKLAFFHTLYAVIVILGVYATKHTSNAQTWTTDVQPTLKIKYGE